MSVRTGSCLCGGVKLALRGDPFMRNLCHCSSCQKFSGAVFGSLAVYKAEVRDTYRPSHGFPISRSERASKLARVRIATYLPTPRRISGLHVTLRKTKTKTSLPPSCPITATPPDPIARQITIDESEPALLKVYEDTTPESGEVLLRSFCGRCGSPVKGQKRSTPENVVVPVGVVDGDKAAFKPDVEFFCRGRADWVGGVEGSQAFEKLPPAQ
ncbi:hypothetical protein F4802DRAFT_597584 [Xylaria palmicola]|nr:hypothetical protein F4802DRAFT_597584 [Xylaria palmicola]